MSITLILTATLPLLAAFTFAARQRQVARVTVPATSRRAAAARTGCASRRRR